ncbi:hypothetical protein RFI_26231 [Reticulomyxa filosa]|uniref:Endonuclease/exonuclease/phosphatase domain-containing protein n=1 Tax=Reticulomyxa filosa TaxID=46433 RepID=X6MAV7_RETFI|nr:hypothetical protein RFI_26231 [Reticulomyxa filosa]|eukprot:ETO11148.1 hypothetical protein RFI_26231 [Reticulomyxa filosa]
MFLDNMDILLRNIQQFLHYQEYKILVKKFRKSKESEKNDIIGILFDVIIVCHSTTLFHLVQIQIPFKNNFFNQVENDYDNIFLVTRRSSANHKKLVIVKILREKQNNYNLSNKTERQIKNLTKKKLSLKICILDCEKAFQTNETFKFSFQLQQRTLRLKCGSNTLIAAHHTFLSPYDTDDVSECILDFIVSSGLHILNAMPFDSTFMKDNATSSIDITLCSSYILPFVDDWRTDDIELDVHSDNLTVTFNIKTTWSSPLIERQKIETWNLRSNKWEQFGLRLKRNIDNWMQSIVLSNTDTLDKAVESWAKCVVEAGEATIWKGNKPLWSDSLNRLQKRVQRSKDRFHKQRTPTNLMLYKKAAKQLRKYRHGTNKRKRKLIIIVTKSIKLFKIFLKKNIYFHHH